MTIATRHDDVLIVGAGIIGIACAHYLNSVGLRVTVIDQGRVRAAGTLAALFPQGEVAKGLEDLVGALALQLRESVC